MYRKRKTTSTPQVDVEELKRQLRREALGDLMPILEASGIQFPNICAVMSNEARKSSLACIGAGVDNHMRIFKHQRLDLQSSQT
jgi:hypothetical protein